MKTLWLRMVPIFKDGIQNLEALSDIVILQMTRTQDTVFIDT